MNINMIDEIKKNRERVLEKIGEAAHSVGRDPDDVCLVVVTKGHPVTVAHAAIEAGARCLGENYVREGMSKMELLFDYDVEWHMIGHVQSRKARDVVLHYNYFHALDRHKIARRCNRYAEQEERVLPVLLECNVSGEGTKSGWATRDENHWSEFADDLAPIFEYDHLDVRGLMTMPPFDPDPETARPYFQKLRRLRDFLAQRFPKSDWSELSMGMSNDFEIAVQEGATLVRVGTAIVGPR
ncbi:MAG: YggS family pyridoxal phosphate-dependent enzyme [Chloroflexota bacterium]|nr:YggS family pyridoxal phosphate-dependent enzyme [Chloroflexota bacterium]